MLPSCSTRESGYRLIQMSSGTKFAKKIIKFQFSYSRTGVQNCEECISNMLKSETCFDSINDYILGQKISGTIKNLVSAKDQDNAFQYPTALKAFKKFKEKKDKKINAGKKEKALVIQTFYVFYTRFVFPEGKSEPRCNEARQTIS